MRGVLGIIAMVGCAAVASALPAQESKDACAPVHAAYQKMLKESNSSNATNAGMNVTEAYEKITSEAGHTETCKYLRDETLAGEPANVYSDVFTSKSGTANGKVWISKKNLWTLKQEVDVDLGAAGKGHQTIVFEYPKK